MDHEFKPAKFSMDCFDDSQPHIDGMTYGYTWNGWACPYFTFENALIVAKHIKDRKSTRLNSSH